jgi:LacI family transcriptional regulator
MVSSLELAKLCGVSQGTVDRALHNRPGISVKTRRRVLEAADRHGYRPNPAVREMLGEAGRMVGAIIPAFNNIFFMDMMTVLKETLAGQGLILVLTPVRQAADFLRALEEFAARKLRAAVVVPPEDRFIISNHLTGTLPVLSLLSPCRGSKVPCLSADEVQTGQTAVNYLAGLGHRRILHVTYGRKAKGIFERAKGYRMQMKALKLRPAVHIYRDQAGLLKILSASKPTALFCHNDWLALSTLRSLQANGIRIPEDISVLGVDHTPTFHTLFPDLSTMNYPLDRFAQCITEWVLAGKIKSTPGPLTIIEGKTTR